MMVLGAEPLTKKNPRRLPRAILPPPTCAVLAHSGPRACAVSHSCAVATAAGTPLAWRGSLTMARCCRSSDGWPAARPDPLKRARSRKPLPPRTGPAPGWPGRGLWTAACRAHHGFSKSVQHSSESLGWRTPRSGRRQSQPGHGKPWGRGRSLVSWRRQACRCSCCHRPSCSPRRLS